MSHSTVPDALRDALRGDTAQPFVTYLGGGGERTELSLTTWENNVAKTANLLRDDVGIAEGDRVVIRLPLHWQTSVWVAACGLVGVTAAVDGDASDAQLAVVGPGELRAEAETTLATSLHPFGLPFATPLPAGVLDAAVEVRVHGDVFRAIPVSPDSVWLERGSTYTQADALRAARELADTLGLAEGGRLLCARALDDTSLLALVAVPLELGGSVVLLTDPSADVDAVAAAERCTAILR